jgi:hypothetical protein
MPGRTMLCLGVSLLVGIPGPARAQHGHGHGGGGHHPHGGGAWLGAAGGGPAFAFPYFGALAVSPYVPTVLVMGPGGSFMPYGPMIPPPMPQRGPLLPAPPQQVAARWPRGEVKPVMAPKSDPARAEQLMTVGDRLFRAGNLKKAEERYQQALRAASDQAAPFLRLAQIALARGHYAAAANRLRDAETAQPGWIVTARDIQAIYGEPAEFARQIARLESHVQSHPDDRDAWLVLGAQWFLTGRTTRASDVFQRLNDPHRKPDIALAAFLEASNQARSRAGEEAGEPAR